jgi:radical SAM superfamily enzyme YgiQ (UPF0313 family)
MQVLLVNPPIYDFTAYDFWLRPYGMLRVAGGIQHACNLTFFDYLISRRRDAWGRGRFIDQPAAKPAVFHDLARRFRRFGRPHDEFREFLKGRHFDLAMIQTSMTYWYPGVREVVEDLRRHAPGMQIILGGIYATLCPAHARSLEVDLVVEGSDLQSLRHLLPSPVASEPYRDQSMGDVAVTKLTDGCPFRCTYCAVPLLYPQFTARPAAECLQEVRSLALSGVRHIAFYDDALLFRAEEALQPFLEGVMREQLRFSFHTPNALNVRFLTPEIAQLMVQAGFCSFFLGLESTATGWLQKTGGKLSAHEFTSAVACLRKAGAQFITAYIIIGHPDADGHEVEASMRFAHEQGLRILLSEFAPVPGTVDGERCREWADLDEPLSHNKTAFTVRRLGADEVKRLKSLCRTLNSTLPPSST